MSVRKILSWQKTLKNWEKFLSDYDQTVEGMPKEMKSNNLEFNRKLGKLWMNYSRRGARKKNNEYKEISDENRK